MSGAAGNSAELDAAISAWLDGELPADEALKLETRELSEPEFGRGVKELRANDALLRAWYGERLTEMETQQSNSVPISSGVSRRWILRVAVVAAVLAIVVAAPFVRQNSTILAEEAIQQTGKAIAEAKGVLAKYESVLTRNLDQPDENGQTQEVRNFKGEIKFGPIDGDEVIFVCNETWAPTADEAELTRQWGQSTTRQWMREQSDGSTTAFEIESTFGFERAAGIFADDAADASPVDPRTRRTVEGLAVLVYSFSRDRYLHWMGYAWTLEGGRGSADNPWVYHFDPDKRDGKNPEPEGAIQVGRPMWTMKLSLGEGGKFLDRIILEETVADPQNGKILSRMQVTYRLEARESNWPAGTFDNGPSMLDGNHPLMDLTPAPEGEKK